MLVPTVEAARTSPSPVNLPPEMEIVALARVVLVMSVIVKFPDNVTGAAPSVYAEFICKFINVALMISSPC
jgi:hypothetical protein